MTLLRMVFCCLLMLAFVATLSGCAPHCESFRFVVMEIPGASVSSAEPPKGVALSNGTTIPRLYRISRDAYDVSVTLGDRSYLPGFAIDVKSRNSVVTLRIEPSPRGGCISWREIDGKLGAHVSQLDCPTGGVIQLRITDGNGVEVGLEEFSYRIVENGVFCVLDGV